MATLYNRYPTKEEVALLVETRNKLGECLKVFENTVWGDTPDLLNRFGDLHYRLNGFMGSFGIMIPEEPEDEEWLCDCDVGDDRRSKWLDKPCSNCNPNEYERMSR